MPDPIKLGLDYSARRLTGASIKNAGYSFVFRYLDFPGQRWPALNREEYDDLTRNGIEVHAIFEINTHDPAGGRDGGKRNAATAVQSARAAGLPQGSVIFMCSDAPFSQWTYSMSTAMDYLDAARAVIEDSGYVIGAYGFKEFIYAAQAGGHADVFWLCGAESGLMDGDTFRNIHAYQWNNGRVTVDGLECDLNKMYIEIGDDMALNADTDYEAFKTMMQRFLVFESRDGGAAPTWENGPTVYERLTAVREETAQILALVRELQTGGVSEERIADIAVEAVRDDLSD